MRRPAQRVGKWIGPYRRPPGFHGKTCCLRVDLKPYSCTVFGQGPVCCPTMQVRPGPQCRPGSGVALTGPGFRQSQYSCPVHSSLISSIFEKIYAIFVPNFKALFRLTISKSGPLMDLKCKKYRHFLSIICGNYDIVKYRPQGLARAATTSCPTGAARTSVPDEAPEDAAASATSGYARRVSMPPTPESGVRQLAWAVANAASNRPPITVEWNGAGRPGQ